jgi:hypothetical protein
VESLHHGGASSASIFENTNPHTDIEEYEITQDIEDTLETEYFDAINMAPLTSASKAALSRLRAFKPPPFSTWDRLHLSRRAAVLILLYADKRGDLRVVITMRASTLRNYSGNSTSHRAAVGKDIKLKAAKVKQHSQVEKQTL